MSTIVQINFDYDEDQAKLESHSAEVAGRFVGLEGLQWKIWLVDEKSKTAGGIYLFESRDKAEAYAKGDMVAHLTNVRDNVQVSVFDTIEAAGEITRAPA
jgi:hypothetical protein